MCCDQFVQPRCSCRPVSSCVWSVTTSLTEFTSAPSPARVVRSVSPRTTQLTLARQGKPKIKVRYLRYTWVRLATSKHIRSIGSDSWLALANGTALSTRHVEMHGWPNLFLTPLVFKKRSSTILAAIILRYAQWSISSCRLHPRDLFFDPKITLLPPKLWLDTRCMLSALANNWSRSAACRHARPQSVTQGLHPLEPVRCYSLRLTTEECGENFSGRL